MQEATGRAAALRRLGDRASSPSAARRRWYVGVPPPRPQSGGLVGLHLQYLDRPPAGRAPACSASRRWCDRMHVQPNMRPKARSSRSMLVAEDDHVMGVQRRPHSANCSASSGAVKVDASISAPITGFSGVTPMVRVSNRFSSTGTWQHARDQANLLALRSDARSRGAGGNLGARGPRRYTSRPGADV